MGLAPRGPLPQPLRRPGDESPRQLNGFYANSVNPSGFGPRQKGKESMPTKRPSKIISALTAASLALALASGISYAADNQPSAKATVKIGEINVLTEIAGGPNETNATNSGWQVILENNIKTPNQKDLIIGVSAEVGLLTDTLVKSKNGVADTSMASAGVEVRVKIDGEVTLPGTVVFGRRTQTLTATFQGIIDGCLILNTNTGGIILDTNCVVAEELQLILETMNANHFNFIAADLVSGVHVVTVEARISAGGSAQAGSFKARGLIGKGSMTVEEIRLIKNEDIEIELP